MMKKEPVKQLPKCYGDPEPECVTTCALEPSCANHWLFEHKRKEEERIQAICKNPHEKIYRGCTVECEFFYGCPAKPQK